MITEVSNSDFFSITKFNEIKSEIDLLFSVAGVDYVNHATASLFPNNNNNANDWDRDRESTYAFLHKHRYLVYVSAENDDGGKLIDPSGVNAEITLPTTNGPDEVGEYDLDSVSWLVPGLMYYVRNVWWSIELQKGDYVY
jgi:hypothetical protein